MRPKTNHDVLARDMIFEHVDCILTCADRLRLHRNLYAHAINWPTEETPFFTLGGMTTKNKNRRFATYEFPIKVQEIQRAASAVRKLVEYTHRVEYCVHLNHQPDRKSSIRWPKRLTPYPLLKKPFVYFTDDTALFWSRSSSCNANPEAENTQRNTSPAENGLR